MTTIATAGTDTTTIDPLRWAGVSLAGSYILLYSELFLTADAEAPNTWMGMFSDTAVLAVAGALAIRLAAVARSGRRAKVAAIACFALTIVFSLPFWTGSAIVLGTTAYALNARDRRPLSLVGAALAAGSALFLLSEIIRYFAPGLPS